MTSSPRLCGSRRRYSGDRGCDVGEEISDIFERLDREAVETEAWISRLMERLQAKARAAEARRRGDR